MAISSAEILPHELMLEILSWLPVTNLMQFRCVSKTWKFLISNPYLVKLHLERSSTNPQILLMEKHRDNDRCFLARSRSLHCLIQNPAPSSCGRIFRCPKSYKYLFGSCNGLLSLHDSLSTNEYEEHWVCFWNPATNICSGPSPSLRLNYGNGGVHHDMYFGFGYDNRRDSCNVVAMVLDWSTLQTSVWVYCMNDVSWRRPSMTSPAFFPFDNNGYSLNGTVNWIGNSLEESRFEELQIFSYDLKNCSCRYLTVPETKDSEFTSMGVLNGCLCVSLDKGMTILVVLALKDVRDETSWSQLVSVSYQTLNISPYYHNLRILCMWGDLLLLTYLKRRDPYNIFIIFNLKENKVERTEGYYSQVFNYIFSCHYAPSLILPI